MVYVKPNQSFDDLVDTLVMVAKTGGGVSVWGLRKQTSKSSQYVTCTKRLTSKPVISQRCRCGSTEGGASIVVSNVACEFQSELVVWCRQRSSQVGISSGMFIAA